MKSNSYWKDRFTKLESALNIYGIDTYRQIEPVFNAAQREIQREIDGWLARIAKNNEVTIAAARKLLNANELAEFRWDVNEYIKYGVANAVDGQWMKQLENASAKVHISLLESLKIRTQQALEVAFGNELDAVDMMARKVYSNGYYRSIFEVQKGFNIGWDIASIDENRLSKIISKPWAVDGKNFSDRIWQSKTSMINELHNQLTRACLLGKAPDEAIKSMSRFVDGKFKNSKAQAGRLVMTEQAFFASASNKDAFNDLDVEMFEIVATLDSLTSAICQEMDGKVFPMNDFEPGGTAPPFHPWCRSCTVPYFDDEFSVGKRAARGEDGKTYYVPSDMTYPEWKKSFVDGGDKNGLQTVGQSGIIRAKNDETASLELKDIDNTKVYKIGIIDRSKYSKISADLLTDEVIITGKQLIHIEERHPGVYDKHKGMFASALADPDRIFRDSKNPNTALVCKEISSNNKNICIVLRLVVVTDNPQFKNSIITAHELEKFKLEKYIKNKETIYKKE